MKQFTDAAVAQTFKTYPPAIRRQLMAVRRLIFDTAASLPAVGPLEETLKWGEPAYLTSQSKSGSTVRMAWNKSRPTQFAVYFNCQTTLVERFRTLFPNDFTFEGNRAILFEESDAVPLDVLALCIAAALTYHRNGWQDPSHG
jgi:hypothetical protein